MTEQQQLSSNNVISTMKIIWVKLILLEKGIRKEKEGRKGEKKAMGRRQIIIVKSVDSAIGLLKPNQLRRRSAFRICKYQS